MYFNDMFPDEIDELINGANGPGKGGAVGVLPVGSVEQHGPHLVLGCDGYNALACSRMIAENIGGICFPMLPFSWIGGLRPYPGTVDMRPFVTGDYMEHAALEIFKQGVERIAIINFHGGGREMVYSIAKKLYKKTRKVILTIYPSRLWDSWGAEMPQYSEGGMLAGALEYLGRDDLRGKTLRDTAAAHAEFPDGYERADTPGLAMAFGISEVGHDYTHECMHVMPEKIMDGGDVARGRKTLEIMAKKIAWGISAVSN